MADITISQGLTIPPGLSTDSIAEASHITPLYHALNAFVLPSTIGAFQEGLVDNNLYTVATGSSQDWTVAALATKAVIAMIPWSWAGGASPTLIFRVNGTAITSALTASATATGSGLILLFLGGHDVDVPRSFIALELDTGAVTTLRPMAANADLPTADTTTIGVTVGAAGVTAKFKFVRFWTQG
jgi:hypothetical protein